MKSAIRNQRSSIAATRQGLALPMTIIAIAGLTLLLVGLLTVLTLERKTARSYSDAARADLAVESGLAVALGSLTEIASRDDSIVFRIEDPVEPTIAEPARPLGFREQFFTYGAVYENGNWRGLPLFSGSPEIALGTGKIEADLLTPELTTYSADSENLSRLSEHDQNIPRAKWVEVPAADPNGYTMRYAFWVEDLSGRIPGKNAGTIPRAEGLSTAELDYATITAPTADNPELPETFTEKRDKLLTSASIRPLFTGASEAAGKRLEPYLHFLPAPTAPTPPKIIPQGFGYDEAGSPAHDLNELIEDKDVDALAAIINLNIPTFEQRKGGFPATEDYVKTLAASIIDYADADSDATTGTGYRGVDSYPFVNELFDRYEWISSPDGEIKISVETYLELWNPSQREASGNVEFTNVNKHTLKIPLTGEIQFSEHTFPAQNVTIPPNGFLVIFAGEHTYTFPEGSFPPSELTFLDPTKNDDYATTENTFQLKWNGMLVDTARGGLQRTDGNLKSGFSNRKWKGNASPVHDSSIGQAGDPRASWYVNTKVIANSYDSNSNWGGRALKRSIGASQPYREVRLEKWGDRGSNSDPGIASGTDARIPTDTKIVLKSSGAAIAGKTFPANQPDMAPTFISNSGAYTSLGELGNIFDPAQWSSVETSSGIASNRAGGGFSLAIGRPEFAPFDKDGLRAAQLLDIFSIPAALPATAAPININTAPREVLRSLVTSVTLDADPMAPEVKLKKTAEIGDIFADYVIAQRNSNPLRSISDLNNIRKQPLITRDPANTDHTPFFGNIAVFEDAPVVTDPAADQIEWDDAGREELFRKVMNLVTFGSKTFRVNVAGEVLDKQGRVISRSAREYHYTIIPERDATGLPVPGGEIRLTKLYEKSL